MKLKLILMVLIISIYTITTSAENTDPHVHGAVTTQILLNEQEGNIIFNLTGMDFIGFGYIAESEKDVNLLENKVNQVQTSEVVTVKKRLFSNVSISEISVTVPHHDDHDDGNVRTSDHDGEHTDYEISLILEYDSIKSLKSINLSGFFKLFPSVEEVDWVMISENGQTAGEVTISKPQVVIK